MSALVLNPTTPVPDAFTRGDARRDWEALLDQLLTRGILYRSETQTIVSRDGTPARWMLESWPVSLSTDGLTLAARCLLRLLEGFEGRQLATYGMTGIPLLSACIQLSGGRYTGLVVRKARKPHGSRKLIEGTPNPSEPVVLVDDSVSSGLSSWEATARLKEAGLFVEGGVCLVRFGYKGGFSVMQAHGKRMRAVFDVWDHLMRNMPDEQLPPRNPSLVRPAAKVATRACAEGLSLPALARAVIAHQVATGEVLKPPRKIDVGEGPLDSAGGAWVSLRSKRQIHHRYARDGFWRFPEDAPQEHIAADVVFAASRTAAQLMRQQGERAAAALDDSAIAVTTFSALERVVPGDLDNDRYGIVVRSAERLTKIGGALPRMPGIEHSWRQLQHARVKNAGLEPFEAYELYRHDVFKRVEVGESWQPTGVPKEGPSLTERVEVCGPVVEHALALARARLDHAPEPPPLSDEIVTEVERGCDAIYVTVYRGGRVVGCMGQSVRAPGALSPALTTLVAAALADSRFDDVPSLDGASAGDRSPADHERLAVSVSFLTHPLALGHFSCSEVMDRVRLGEQALAAQQGDKHGLLLPFVAAQRDLGREAFAQNVLQKAGIAGGRVNWTRYDADTWLDDGGGPRKLVGAFPAKRRRPKGSTRERTERLARLCAQCLTHHQRADGDHYLSYAPLNNHLQQRPDLARLAHGAWLLARAAAALGDAVFEDAARRRVAFLAPHVRRDPQGRAWLMAPHVTPTLAELSLTVLTSLELEGPAAAHFAAPLCDTLLECLDVRGRFTTHLDPQQASDAWQDYTPGQALLAIGAALPSGLLDIEENAADKLVAAWRQMRLRADVRPHPGLVSFLPQAALVWDELAGGDANAHATFALADWIAGFQATGGRFEGAFLNDHQIDTPGFTTALYVEGLAAAGLLALRRGEPRRARQGLDRCARALTFLETLVIDEDEAAVLPHPALARGGVRPSHIASHVRIDMPGHTLAACLGLLSLLNALER